MKQKDLRKYRKDLRIQRKEVLLNKILNSKRTHDPLEIIIKTEDNKRVKEKVAKQMQSLGKITHVFQKIPYLSLVCMADDAEQIFNKINRKQTNRIFEKSFRYSLNAAKAVDLSGKFSTIPVKIRSGTYKNTKSNLWNLEMIGAYKAHSNSRGNGAKIAIIDTGVDYNHDELKKNFTYNKGYDFVENNNSPMDKEGHGTHVAGTAAGKDCGVAPDATLYSLRVLNEYGSGSDADVAAAIEWAITNNMHVANMSLGGPGASSALEEMCRIASQNGLLLVAAAGNTGGVDAEYPAAFGDYVIAVAAVDSEKKHAYFSTIWETNDISAPGEGIYSALLGGGYTYLSGTSMATPHVAGGLGLLMSKSNKPNLAEDIMHETAEKLPYNGEYDYGWVFGSGLLRADSMINNFSLKGRIQRLKNIKSYKSTIKKVAKTAWRILY
ncbi:MAG: S8 family peptidase [Candidatus Nanoarchaeia archaeon]|nr:S8 family peptidase [Candidatus Nanoarchaeia archaeon]